MWPFKLKEEMGKGDSRLQKYIQAFTFPELNISSIKILIAKPYRTRAGTTSYITILYFKNIGQKAFWMIFIHFHTMKCVIFLICNYLSGNLVFHRIIEIKMEIR